MGVFLVVHCVQCGREWRIPYRRGSHLGFVGPCCTPSVSNAGDRGAPPPAVTDGPVADDAEPVAAQAVVACPDTHRLDLDAVTHG